MAYGWQVKLNGVDISDKCSGFSITSSLDSYCREMTLDIADAALYASLDFTQISESPEIEILTKNGSAFVSQGLFYIERPAVIDATHSELMTGVWGRSITAMLAEPFAPKVSKTWTERTTFLGVVEEMCELAGFTWNASYCEIEDFVIYANTYECDGIYPIDVITELAELAGALVTTDREGHLCIKQIDYSPATADFTITDDDIASLSESPEWPVFGNRVTITPTGASAGYDVTVTIMDECLPADETTRTRIYAQVMGEDDEPVNGVVVTWSLDDYTLGSLDRATSNTAQALIRYEAQEADNFYSVSVEFEPSSVLGVWAASDTAKKTNLAAGGYTVDGNTITLTNKLSYCNQALIISYYSEGIAINYLTAGAIAGDVTVTADIEGQTGTGMVYIDNPCQCPPEIKLTANPSSININEKSQLLVYVEESGPVTSGRYVFMGQTSATKRGALSWTKARLGRVSIKNEKTSAINDLDGVTQCEISMYPASVSSVYLADADGEPTGDNLYASYDGKIITLDEEIDTGTSLLVNYTAQGAALNELTGNVLGEARVTAWITCTLEEGCEDSTTIDIEDDSETTDDYPEDYEESEGDGTADGGSGGLDDDYDEDDYDPAEDVPGGGTDPCMPESVSENPTQTALLGRFATGRAAGCSCEEMCQNELDLYATTQNYDDASGRSIRVIVLEDYGYDENSAEFWEKYDELKAAALQACQDQCDDCASVSALTINADMASETISAGGGALITVSGGMPPYTFSTSSLGYSFGVSNSLETDSDSVTLICVEGECGSEFDPVGTVTVTDACGQSVTWELRNTAGNWGTPELICQKGTVQLPAGKLYGEPVGKYKYEYWYNSGACPGGDGGGAYACDYTCITVGTFGAYGIETGMYCTVKPDLKHLGTKCVTANYLYRYEWSC